MAVASYDVTIASARTVAVTAIMCSAPTYSVDSVRVRAWPVFRNASIINGEAYAPGERLVTATGGTVNSTSPFIAVFATTAQAARVDISGTYSSAATAATFVIPFGATFNSSTLETDVGGSPRQYSYIADFIATYGGATVAAETIVSGQILVTIENDLRVPLVPKTSNKACSVTQI